MGNHQRISSTLVTWTGMAVLAAFLAVAPHASALTISSGFVASGFDSTGASVPPLDPVSGSYAISFDESSLTGVGFELGFGTVDAISLVIAGTNYTTGNTSVAFTFTDGNISGYSLGTDVFVNGVLGCSVTAGDSDFCLIVDNFPSFTYSASTGDIYAADTVSVLEPPLDALQAAALAAAFGRSRFRMASKRQRSS